MRWISWSVAASFQEKCVWASTIPGMSVAPAPSITVAPATGRLRVPRATRPMRLPWTSTSPANGAPPLPSNTRTFVNSTVPM